MTKGLSGGVGALHIEEGPTTDLHHRLWKEDVADIERLE